MYVKISGLNEVVCSPIETGKVHNVCRESFLTITLGVHFSDSEIGY